MHPDEPNSEIFFGGQGGVLRSPSDIRLIERALRDNWEFPEGLFANLPREANKLAIDPNMAPRVRVSAIRCLMAMKRQNLDAALHILNKLFPDLLTISAGANPQQTDELRQLLAELRSNDDWIEAQRAIAVGGSGLAGPHGAGGIAGPLADGASPAPP